MHFSMILQRFQRFFYVRVAFRAPKRCQKAKRFENTVKRISSVGFESRIDTYQIPSMATVPLVSRLLGGLVSLPEGWGHGMSWHVTQKETSR